MTVGWAKSGKLQYLRFRKIQRLQGSWLCRLHGSYTGFVVVSWLQILSVSHKSSILGPASFFSLFLGGDGLGKLLLSQSRCKLYKNMLLIECRFDLEPETSHFTRHLWHWRTFLIVLQSYFLHRFYMWFLDELFKTILQEKTNTVGAFSSLITQTFHQISSCSGNYFHWHSHMLFVFFQDTAKWKCGRSPSFYSPLVHKNTELCYLWLRSDLRAESVKLRAIVRVRQPTIIFAISPEFCVLYFYPFKARVTDRWQQPGWEMGWGFVHGIMQHHISANSRVLWLSKTSRCISLKVLWKIQPSPSLSLSLSPVLFTIIYLAETVLH